MMQAKLEINKKYYVAKCGPIKIYKKYLMPYNFLNRLLTILQVALCSSDHF